jgi:hypothetical protein
MTANDIKTTHWAHAHRLFLAHEGLPEAAQHASKNAFARFFSRDHGEHEGLLPDRKVENWKYTSLRHLDDMQVLLEAAPEPWKRSALDHVLAHALMRLGIPQVGLGTESTSKPSPQLTWIVLLLAGGRLVRTVVPQEFAHAVQVDETIDDAVAAETSSSKELWGQSLENLHRSFVRSSVTVSIHGGSMPATPRILVVDAHNRDWSMGSFSVAQLKIRLAKDSHAKLIHVQADNRSLETLKLTRTQVELQSGASLHHLVTQETLQGHHLVTLGDVHCDEHARYHMLVAGCGGGLIRNHTHVTLAGDSASCWLGGGLQPRTQGHIDNLTRIHHAVGPTKSEQVYKHLVDDKGTAVFRGIIDIAKGADGAEAHQISRSLLLGPESQANSKPELVIGADDVVCTHGASVGPLAEEEVFYLKSRGLPPQEAVALMCSGFLGEAAQVMSDEDLGAGAKHWLLAKPSTMPTGDLAR